MESEWAKQFYWSTNWKKCRDSYRHYRRGLCERCLEKGLITPGTQVHHIVKLTPKNINDPNVTLNWDNLMLLCDQCHAEIHEESHRKKPHPRYTVDAYGKVTATQDEAQSNNKNAWGDAQKNK